MNEGEVIAFYRATVVDVARRMPLSEATSFLLGALMVAGDHTAMHEVRTAYVNLQQADAQLELIASPQLKLPLKSDGNGKKGAA